MAKPLIWVGKNEAGEQIRGEGYDDADCRLRAESQGCVEFSTEENPEHTVQDEIEAAMPVIANSSKGDVNGEDTVTHLAQANAKLFEQNNELKNKRGRAEDLAYIVISKYSMQASEEEAKGEEGDKQLLAMVAIAREVVS